MPKAKKENSRQGKKDRTWEKCYNVETMAVVAGMYRDGANDVDVAEYLGVSVMTLFNWKQRHPEFAQIVSETKEVVDRKVENALLKRALGFKCEERKQLIKDGIVIKEEVTEKNILPDVTACAVWLNNRKPDCWRRNRDAYESNEGKDNIQINVIKSQARGREIEKEVKKDNNIKGRIKQKKEQ